MDTEILLDQTFTLSAGVIATQVDGESVLLDSSNGQYFGLNETGTLVLASIEKQQTFSDICEHLSSQYPENQTEIKQDVNELIAALLKNELIKRD